MAGDNTVKLHGNTKIGENILGSTVRSQARREALMNRILDIGLVRKLNFQKLAAEFNVSIDMIRKDIQVVKAYMRHNFGKDALLEIESMVHSCYIDAMALRDVRARLQATKVLMDLYVTTGRIEKIPDKIELSGDIRTQVITLEGLREAYKEAKMKFRREDNESVSAED